MIYIEAVSPDGLSFRSARPPTFVIDLTVNYILFILQQTYSLGESLPGSKYPSRCVTVQQRTQSGTD